MAAEKLHPAILRVVESITPHEAMIGEVADRTEKAALTAQRELMAEGVRRYAQSRRSEDGGYIPGTFLRKAGEVDAENADEFADRLERNEGAPE